MSPEIGLVEGYERVTFLGRGGTAVLYSARHIDSGDIVVLKVFDPEQSTAAQRHRHVAERLARVDGVVADIGGGVLTDGREFIVMPFIAGGALSDHTIRFGPMLADDVAAFGSTLAMILAGAHREGVVHRDIKPSNVLLADDGSPMLCDFGASMAIDLTTATDTMAITLLYAAPEVLGGAPADERSDIYALGLTLTYAAVGSHPFGGSSETGLVSLVNRIASVGPEDPEARGVPSGLAGVLRTATALDPADRYQTAIEFAAALDKVAPSSGNAAAGDGNEVTSDGDKAVGDPGTANGQHPVVSSGDPEPIYRRRSVIVSAVILGLMAVAVIVTVSVWRAVANRGEVATPDPGRRATDGSGVLGPLYQTDDFTYAGQMTRECDRSDRWVAMAIHADQNDRRDGVAEPWAAVTGEHAGTFMAYLPCEGGGRNISYVLRAPGRWFVVLSEFPDDQYNRMVEWMRENETSPAPDYTVDDEIRETLTDEDSYHGWEIIDRKE